MATSRRFVQITDKEINKIKITCVKILKQLFASGSVIFGKYSPRPRLGEYVRVKYREGGSMSYTTHEDAQRPRAVYDIHPDFRGI